jgi:hypothetical protein
MFAAARTFAGPAYASTSQEKYSAPTHIHREIGERLTGFSAGGMFEHRGIHVDRPPARVNRRRSVRGVEGERKLHIHAAQCGRTAILFCDECGVFAEYLPSARGSEIVTENTHTTHTHVYKSYFVERAMMSRTVESLSTLPASIALCAALVHSLSKLYTRSANIRRT